MRHYHIRWRDSKLDWEAFQTQASAEIRAAAIARPNETFIVEQFDGDCPMCAEFGQRMKVQVRANCFDDR